MPTDRQGELEQDDYGTAVAQRVDVKKPLLCRLGLHRMSTNRGGIKICRRDGCRKTRLFGLTGMMREMEWKDELYEKYERLEEQERDRDE